MSVMDGIVIEEVRRKRAGQGSGDGLNQDMEEEIEKLRIIIDDKVETCPSSSKQSKFKTLDDALAEEEARSSEAEKPKIQRIPFMLRNINADFKKHYEPRLVSIGPIHHRGNAELKLAEKLKRKLAALFIKECGQEKEVLYSKIMVEVENLRKCYQEEIIKCYDNEELAWIFLVDGCFVLQYICCTGQGKKLEDLKIKPDQVAFTAQDLLLLENQLPYQVLELLISSCSTETLANELRNSIERFVNDNIMSPYRKRKYQLNQQRKPAHDSLPAHLLDLVRRRVLDKSHKEAKSFTDCLIDCYKEKVMEGQNDEDQIIYSFRNIKELRAAGIRLSAYKKASCLTEISFKRLCFIGNLCIPPLIVDDSTEPKLLNLVAYEMCPDFDNDFGVTSYVCFLDSLIDEAEDVQALRNAGILHNSLGSDAEVANIFNKVGTDLVPNPSTYTDIKNHIHRHCKNPFSYWIAQGYSTHFSSPWTLVAFFAGITALVLSFLQTWYTIHPKDDPSKKIYNCTCKVGN